MAAVAAAADQARRTGALEVGPQGLVAVGQRGRQERGLGRPGAPSPRSARRRSPPGSPATWRRSSAACASSGTVRSRSAASSASMGSCSSMATSSSSSSSARRSVRCRTSSFMACRSRPEELVAAYIRFSMTLPPLADDGDLLLEVLLGGGEHAAARRGVRPLGLERGQLAFHGSQPRRLEQGGTPVLELRDGGVEVLDGEQMRQVVRHAHRLVGGAGQRQRVDQRGVGHGQRLVPTAPAGVGALVRRGHRVGVRAEQEVAQVEMRVRVGRLVDVEMDEAAGRPAGCSTARPSSSVASRNAALVGTSRRRRCGRRAASRCRAACAGAAPCRGGPTTMPDAVTWVGPACSSYGAASRPSSDRKRSRAATSRGDARLVALDQGSQVLRRGARRGTPHGPNP